MSLQKNDSTKSNKIPGYLYENLNPKSRNIVGQNVSLSGSNENGNTNNKHSNKKGCQIFVRKIKGSVKREKKYA